MVFSSVPYIYHITLRLDDNGRHMCFNRLSQLLSLNLPNNIQELLVLFQWSLENPDLQFKDGVYNNNNSLPDGQYEGYTVKCRKENKIIFKCKVDNKERQFVKKDYCYECYSNDLKMGYVIIDNDYIFVNDKKKSGYIIGEKINKKDDEIRKKNKKFLSLNSVVLKSNKKNFKKGSYMELFILDSNKRCESESDNEDEKKNRVLIMKIGNNEIYYSKNELLLNDIKNKEIDLIKVEIGGDRIKPLSQYKIVFLKDFNGIIEIGSEGNKGDSFDDIVLNELRVFGDNGLIDDYIFTLPFIGKDLVGSNDFSIEITGDIKIIEKEFETEMLLKEIANICVYDNKYYVNKQEKKEEMVSKVKMSIELKEKWSSFQVFLSVCIIILVNNI